MIEHSQAFDTVHTCLFRGNLINLSAVHVLIRELNFSYHFNFRRILGYQFKIEPINSQRSQSVADLRSQL